MAYGASSISTSSSICCRSKSTYSTRGERPNYELMLDIVAYLRDYSDRFHHPREDVAFARLAKHCPDLQLVLARLARSTASSRNAGRALLGQLRSDARRRGHAARATVEVAAATYLVYYGNHIAKEEEDVLTRAAKEADGGGLGSGAQCRAVRPRSAVRRRPRGALSRTAPADRDGSLAGRARIRSAPAPSGSRRRGTPRAQMPQPLQ